jgi:hypothetical protein
MHSRDVQILVCASDAVIFDQFVSSFESIIDRIEICTFPFFYQLHFTLYKPELNLQLETFHVLYILIDSYLDKEEQFINQLPNQFPVFYLSKSVVVDEPNFMLLKDRKHFKSLYKKTTAYCTNIIFPTLEKKQLSTPSFELVPYVQVKDTQERREVQLVGQTDHDLVRRLDRIERKLDLLLSLIQVE